MNKVDIPDALASISKQLNLLSKINSIYINNDDADAMAEQLIELSAKLNVAANALKVTN